MIFMNWYILVSRRNPIRSSKENIESDTLYLLVRNIIATWFSLTWDESNIEDRLINSSPFVNTKSFLNFSKKEMATNFEFENRIYLHGTNFYISNLKMYGRKWYIKFEVVRDGKCQAIHESIIWAYQNRLQYSAATLWYPHRLGV